MAKQELIEYSRQQFESQENLYGYTNPRAVAEAMIGNHTISSLHDQIKRKVMRMPTENYLYPGAKDTIRQLLIRGDEVIIWTQGHERGQLWKVGLSGLSSLRKELPTSERKRFSMFSSLDKIKDLPHTCNQLINKGVTNIIIVDDKAKNIAKTARHIDQWKKDGQISESIDIQLVWINQGRTKDLVPEDYTFESFAKRFRIIQDIQELKTIPKPSDGKVGWLIDFDHTLVNTKEAKDAMFEEIAGLLEKAHPRPVISYSADYLLRLNGNVKKTELLLSGMSGGKVIKIETDSGIIVAKNNPADPEKIKREIKGYEILQDTPIGQRMHKPIFVSGNDALLAIPYSEGVQLRIGIRQEILPEEIVSNTIAELLRIKKEWWSKQTKTNPNGELVSMQRNEWNDTQLRIILTLNELSQKFSIPIEALWKYPIVHNGSEYPPLNHTVSQVHELLTQPVSQTVLAHNDATGANILVNSGTGQWHLVDAEWAGFGDPAEAYVRMIKYLSTTTLERAESINANAKNGKLSLDLDLVFPKTAVLVQQYGLEMIPFFGHSLKDPDFQKRVSLYFAGSYLRELALSQKRGYPELGFFAMLKATEVVTL